MTAHTVDNRKGQALAKKNSRKKEKGRSVLLWIIVIVMLSVAGYQMYSGAYLKKIGIPGIFELEFGERAPQPVPQEPTPTPGGGVTVKPPIPTELPPLPEGLVIFNANEWHEQVISGKKEIVCKPQTELNVDLRKVGIGIEDPIVERLLTYSKPQHDALEIEYEFTRGTEIGVHFLVHGFRKDHTNFIRLDEYEEGCVFLRVKPMAIDEGTNTDDSPAVSFGLKLRQGDTWFWDSTHHSSSNAKVYEQSGWRDIRIPIRPYLDQMRMVSSTVSEPLRLEQLLIIFGDMYASPRRGRFWLNVIVLVKK